MQFLLELNQEKSYGQIPITGPNGKIQYFIRGNLDNPNHTLYLSDLNNNEIGRLFTDEAGLIASFTIDVINHSLVKVKKVNTPLTNLFYVTRLNYLVTGSIKKGTYTFRSGLKNVASVKTIMGNSGVVLVCNVTRPEDIPFILLISILFTQWHVTPLRLPTFPPMNTKFSTDPN
ncbi:hypothetical protein GCM10022297_14350 [Lactobacillus hamsteri]|uniref:Uncharacterized protein n=1 Tax=Lactobacillus hamsteri DSM 5661 = JCM 6256 TaxID=1423754 RepID=A0A0R1YK23_9LACO|nr:hypothetical protein [Lactobacillus hamsteri]KRM40217.1 hypothetical protein FC39_GL000831 [Lactobacillus hamsteri DSM 5661 = JCM 6256]